MKVRDLLIGSFKAALNAADPLQVVPPHLPPAASFGKGRVMVIGAGDTSEKAARALLSRGARSILVSNRSHDRAEALAQRGITCVDLAPVFRHRVTRSEPLFLTARGLPNATGATLIATHVIRHLTTAASRYGLLPWQAAAAQIPPEVP